MREMAADSGRLIAGDDALPDEAAAGAEAARQNERCSHWSAPGPAPTRISRSSASLRRRNSSSTAISHSSRTSVTARSPSSFLTSCSSGSCGTPRLAMSRSRFAFSRCSSSAIRESGGATERKIRAAVRTRSGGFLTSFPAPEPCMRAAGRRSPATPAGRTSSTRGGAASGLPRPARAASGEEPNSRRAPAIRHTDRIRLGEADRRGAKRSDRLDCFPGSLWAWLFGQSHE
jgi:hypothetical protein